VTFRSCRQSEISAGAKEWAITYSAPVARQ
jgi:hypothetical protein